MPIWPVARDPGPSGTKAQAAEITTKTKWTVRDGKKATRGRRYNIRPDDAEFVAKEREFAAMLAHPNLTTNMIIDKTFDSFERKMLEPANKQSDPTLFEIQQENRARFNEICKTGRFKGKVILLQTKLAMLWFGLPVEPMKHNPFKSFGINQDEDDIEDFMDMEMGEMMEFSPEPLKCLNAYEDRAYGKDRYRYGQTEYDKYYTMSGLHPEEPPPLSLRGGGLFDDDSDENEEMVDNIATDEDDCMDELALNLRGGAGVVRGVAKTPFTDTYVAGKSQLWFPLHGFAGIVHFEIHSYDSFVDAVARLLDLPQIDGAEFDLYFNDLSGVDDAPGVHNMKFGTPNTRDQWNEMSRDLPRADYIDRFALFAALRGTRAFLDFEPESEDDLRARRAIKLTNRTAGQPYSDAAYLHIPKNPGQLANNHIEPWFRAALRILTPGRIKGEPGLPRIAPGYAVIDNRFCFNMYGGVGIHRGWWQYIVQKFESGSTEIDIKWLSPTERPVLLMPGENMTEAAFRIEQEGKQTGSLMEKIDRRLEAALRPRDHRDLTKIRFWSPGEGMLDPAGKPNTIHLEKQESRDWVDILGHQPDVTWVAFQPIYDSYTAHLPGGKKAKFDLLGSLDAFRTMAYSKGGIPKGSGLRIIQVTSVTLSDEEFLAKGLATEREKEDFTREVERRLQNRAEIHIAPQTTEEEWLVLRNYICERDVHVIEVGERQTPAEFKHLRNLWGCGWDRERQQQSLNAASLAAAAPPNDGPTVEFAGNTAPTATTRTAGQGPPAASASEREERLRTYYRDRLGLRDHQVDDMIKSSQEMRDRLHAARKAGVGNQARPRGRLLSQAGGAPKAPEAPAAEGDKSATNNRLRGYAEPRGPIGGMFDPVAPPNQSKTPMTEGQRNARLREMAYTDPLSIFGGGVPHMPLHAPPLETFVKPRGGTGAVPLVSRGLLTPTEAQKLHKAVHWLHKVALDRVLPCPYAGCDAFFPVGERERLTRHMLDTHQSETCNFCDAPLYRHWSRAQRQNHYLTRHGELFADRAKTAGDAAAGAALTPAMGRVHAREFAWHFCARCGRDHHVLYNLADRNKHDNECYPGLEENPDRPARAADYGFCEACGGGVKRALAARHRCRRTANEAAPFRPYCKKCGLALGRFSAEYRALHRLNCKGAGNNRPQNKNAAFCPWCGVEMLEGVEHCVRHLAACEKNVDGAEGPLDLATGRHLEGDMRSGADGDGGDGGAINWRRLDAHRRAASASPLETRCPFCDKDFRFFSAESLWTHWETDHAHEDMWRDLCVYCDFPYRIRGFKTREEKVSHLDDHVAGRLERTAADKTIATTDPDSTSAKKARETLQKYPKPTGSEAQMDDEAMSRLNDAYTKAVRERDAAKAQLAQRATSMAGATKELQAILAKFAAQIKSLEDASTKDGTSEIQKLCAELSAALSAAEKKLVTGGQSQKTDAPRATTDAGTSTSMAKPQDKATMAKLVSPVKKRPAVAPPKASTDPPPAKSATSNPVPSPDEADEVDDDEDDEDDEDGPGARRSGRRAGKILDPTYYPKPGDGQYPDDKDKDLEDSAVRSSEEDEAAAPGPTAQKGTKRKNPEPTSAEPTPKKPKPAPKKVGKKTPAKAPAKAPAKTPAKKPAGRQAKTPAKTPKPVPQPDDGAATPAAPDDGKTPGTLRRSGRVRKPRFPQ